ncbi:FG-GAP repeat [Comamonadaceae bacterium]
MKHHTKNTLISIIPLALALSACGGGGGGGGGTTGSTTDSSTTWAAQAYVKASNAEASDRFGTSVAISGDTMVVGANLEDSSQTTITNGSTASADNSASLAGAAYVFTRN